MSNNKQRKDWEIFPDHKTYRDALGWDPAWENDTERSNPHLKDGDRVRMKTATVGDGPGRGVSGYWVPEGAEGTVSTARTPRVTKRPGRRSEYFANVNIELPQGGTTRVRVPHGALKRL